MNSHWASESFFYHLFPLGMLGQLGGERRERNILELLPWLDRAKDLGAGAIILGPVLASSWHGYDTTDLFRVDPRLGTEGDFVAFMRAARDLGLRVVLDAVFNHVGREHPAFRELRERRGEARRLSWFKGLDFSRDGPYRDGFDYEGWRGCKDLVALDHSDPGVRDMIFAAVERWINVYGADGIRLDAADSYPLEFQAEVARRARALKPDFFVLAEVVHGDYGAWIGEGGSDSVTDYEAYKGLWSSLNDRNYFEIAWTLDRLFAAGGRCEGRPLLNFVDNHDVTRAASILRDPALLGNLYAMLFTMPGIPAVYYGSERAVLGRKEEGDPALRPELAIGHNNGRLEGAALEPLIRALARARRASEALREGSYRKLHLENTLFAFERLKGDERVVACFNSEDVERWIPIPLAPRRYFVDLLDKSKDFHGEDKIWINVGAIAFKVLQECRK